MSFRLRGFDGGRWNDIDCNDRKPHIICASLEDETFDVYVFSAAGVSIVLLITFALLFFTERRSLRRLREIEHWDLK